MQMTKCRRKPLMYFAAILLSLILVEPALAKGPAGQVHFVPAGSVFFQRGGDCATQSAGTVQFKQTLFDGLTEADVNQVEIPAIAKEWKIAPDWSYIDFFIRNDVKFHNGALVTVEDIKYSLETHMDRKNRFILGNTFREMIKDIQIISPTQIRFNMNKPFWGLLGRLWWGVGIFPKEYRERVGSNGFADCPVGAGPFKWTPDWKQDQYFVAEAVQDHYRHPPQFKTLRISYVPEAATRVAILQSGEGDIVMLDGRTRPIIEADPNLRVLRNWYTSGSGMVYLDLAFPNEKSPFHDPRVRDAVSLAIDRETICEKVFFGSSKPYGYVLTPITLGYEKELAKGDPFDPEKAKKLLVEAGYPNGFETIYHTTSGGQYYAEAITSCLANVGIKAKIQLWEAGALYNAFRQRKMRGLNIRISWYNAERHSSLYDGYAKEAQQCYHTTPEIIEALDKAERALTDEDRARTNRDLARTIKAAKIRADLWTTSETWGIGPRIKYWQPKIGAAPGVSLEYVTLKK